MNNKAKLIKKKPQSKQLFTKKKDFFASIGDGDSTLPASGPITSIPYDEVVHPSHYNQLPNGIECWDVNEHFPTNIGSAIKYLWRAGLKPGQETVKDLNKAIQYTQRQINLLEGRNPKMS